MPVEKKSITSSDRKNMLKMYSTIVLTRSTKAPMNRNPSKKSPNSPIQKTAEQKAIITSRSRDPESVARTVFRVWGIHATADFGELVFNLVEANLMSKTSDDRRSDFADVYDLDEALGNYRIILEEETEGAT